MIRGVVVVVGGNKHGDSIFLLGTRRASWLVHFLFQGLEFLAFVRMNALTYEWSLASPARANHQRRARDPSNNGRGVWRSSQSCARLLFWIFQLFFIHKKERRKVRDREKKTPPFIKKKPVLARRVLTCFSFFQLGWTPRTWLCLPQHTSLGFWKTDKAEQLGRKVAQTTAGTLYISSKKVMQFGSRLCIFAFLRSKVCATQEPRDLKFPKKAFWTEACGK